MLTSSSAVTGARSRTTTATRPDRQDETWVGQDLVQIADDQLGRLLSQVRGNVLVISDSCHSGTVTKDALIGPRGKVKFLETKDQPGEPERLRLVPRDILPGPAVRQERRELEGFPLIAACSDAQQANDFDGRQNSAFTGALLQVVQQSDILTFGALRQEVAAIIANRAYPTPQTPSIFCVAADQAVPSVLQGTREQARASAAILRAEAEARVHLALTGLLDREEVAPGGRRELLAKVEVAGGGTTFETGDRVVFSLTGSNMIPSKGAYLLVFNVGPTGKVTLLFPNSFEPTLRLRRGQRLTIGEESSLRFHGAKGKEVVLVYALDWNPLAGLDLEHLSKEGLAGEGLVLLKSFNGVRSRSLTGNGPGLTARDIRPGPPERSNDHRGSDRPGEGWDRHMLELTHR